MSSAIASPVISSVRSYPRRQGARSLLTQAPSLAPPRVRARQNVTVAAALQSPDAQPTVSRRAVLGGAAALGAGLAAWQARQEWEASHPAEPWLACNVEPHASLPLDPEVHAALYPGGVPRQRDVRQGDLGDCYLLASVLAVLNKWPNEITRRIRYRGRNADGTMNFQVALQHRDAQGKVHTEWVCVTSTFPDKKTGGALWVSLIEKAFAKFNDQHHVLRNPSLAGYDALEIGGQGQGLEALTGRPARFDAFSARVSPIAGLPPVPTEALIKHFKHPRTVGFVAFFNTLGAPTRFELQDGSAITVSGVRMVIEPPGKAPPIALYTMHAYAVVQVNAQGDFLLRNPHGKNPGNPNAEFWLPRKYVPYVVTIAVSV